MNTRIQLGNYPTERDPFNPNKQSYPKLSGPPKPYRNLRKHSVLESTTPKVLVARPTNSILDRDIDRNPDLRPILDYIGNSGLGSGDPSYHNLI